ncbi:4Fe-4S binding protein [Xanthomonas fragariae]
MGRGKPIEQSSCVSCGHCVTVCPCNALLEKPCSPKPARSLRCRRSSSGR